LNRIKEWVKTHKLLAIILAGIPLALCVCCLILVIIPTPEDSTDVLTQNQSATSLPTGTSTPTVTPQPTATNTPIPLAPSCEQIQQETDGMTDVQWDVYKKNFKGLWVDNWEGVVTEVSKEFLGSNFNVHVETPDGCTVLVQVKDEETALTFSRGDRVVLSGITSSLGDIFGKVIYMDDDESSISKK